MITLPAMGNWDALWRRGWNMIAGPLLMLVLIADTVLFLLIEVLYLQLYLGAVAFPITVLLAGVVNVATLRAAKLVSTSAAVILLPVGVWTVGFLIIATVTPGGDVLLGTDGRTLLLLACGLIPPMVDIFRGALRPAVT